MIPDILIALGSGLLLEVVCLVWTRGVVERKPARTAIVSFVTVLLNVSGIGAAMRNGWPATLAFAAGCSLSAYACLRWGRRWL